MTSELTKKVEQLKNSFSVEGSLLIRLYRYYVEKLFLDGVGSFEWDW